MSYKKYFHQRSIFVIMVLFGTGIGIGPLLQTQPISSANATVQSQLANGTVVNDTAILDPSSEINTLTAAFGEPFYELNDSKDTGYEVISIEPQQTKSSYISYGNMQGIGNVTEYGTFINSFSSPIVSSDGKGMIVDGDQVVTFTAKDTGRYDNDGNLFLKGTMFFQSDDKEMESINGKIGLYLYWKNSNGTDWTKLWLWE